MCTSEMHSSQANDTVRQYNLLLGILGVDVDDISIASIIQISKSLSVRIFSNQKYS